MMKRIVILHFAAPPVIGGVESTILHHSQLLASAGWEVTILAGRGKEFQPGIRVLILPAIDSRHPEILRIGEKLAQGVVDQDFYRIRDSLAEVLAPLLIEADAAIIHNVHTLHKNLPLTAALHRLNEEHKPPQIAWCHDFAWHDRLYQPQLHPGYPWDLLRTLWRGVRYVAVSEHRRQRLADLLGASPDLIEVIPPGIAFTGFMKFEPLTRRILDRLNLRRAEPIFLLPARITRRKNIEFAIRVIAEIRKTYPDAALLVTGPPGAHNPTNLAYLDSLRELREELGVTKNVHFLYELGESGKPLELPDAVITDLYQVADALLFPSKREGFGIPVLEAGLSRMPVFAADIPSIRESSSGYAHLFALSCTPESVGQAIISRLQSDSAFRLRRSVLANYTWDSIVRNRVIPLIESVLLKP
jgi:glycosyltransferase involved in cell wall biosynthesis